MRTEFTPGAGGTVAKTGGLTPQQKGMTRADEFANFTLGVIVEVMQSKGADTTHAGMLVKTQQWPPFRAKFHDDARPGDRVGSLTTFFDRVVKRNRVAQHALMRISIGLLYEDLVQMNIAVSSRAVMAHIHRIPSVLNKAFPGYASAGLLPLVVREDQNVRSQ